jgi:predicted kinase
MKKLVLTQGAPGSGKTTWANEYVAANPGWYVLSRDDLREGIFGLDKRNDYKYSKLREKSVSVCQFSMAKTLLEMETTKGVIIADTNLNPTTIKKWQELSYEFDDVMWEIKRFDVPWTELIKRNLYRGANAVPIEVLRSFYSMIHLECTNHMDASWSRSYEALQ